MPKIKVVHKDGHESVHEFSPTGEVGDSFLDAVERAGAELPYGCRAGACGTCMVEVLDGLDQLGAQSPLEEDTLSRAAPSKTCRLMCRVKLSEVGPGPFKVRPLFS